MDLLLTCWLLHPLSTSPSASLYDASTFTGEFLNQPDVTLNAWILAWGTHALSTARVPGFFDANVFYPTQGTLALSEHMLGVIPFFGPVYLLTGKLALSFNLWILFTFVASGLSMYWVTFRWLGSHLAAAIASIVFAFAPWRFSELSHAQLLSVQYLPLLTYALWITNQRRDLRLWSAIFGLLVLQALSSYYLGYMAFVVVVLVSGVLVAARSEGRARTLLFITSAMVAVALVMVPLSLPYLELGRRGGFSGKIGAGDADLAWSIVRNFIFPLFGDLTSHRWYAWKAIPWVGLAGAVLGLGARRTRLLAAIFVLVGFVGILLGMMPSSVFWGVRIGVIDKLLSSCVPGWSALRVMMRFGILFWFSISLLAAVPFASPGGRRDAPRRLRTVLGVALIAALLASSASLEIRTRPAPEVSRDLHPYAWLARNGGGDPLLEWPMAGLARWNSEYMYLSSLHWLPLVNGYSGYVPDSNAMIRAIAESLPARAAARTLVSLDLARWVLVHRPVRPAARRDWDQLSRVGGVLRLEGKDFRLYELPFDGDRPSPVLAGDPAGRSIFAISKRRLGMEELDARILPARRSVVDRLWLGLPLTWRLRNRSRVRWPGVGIREEGLVGLVFHVRREGGSSWKWLRGFNRLPADLGPGEEALVQSRIFSPRESGRYTLVPCLKQSGGRALRCFDGAAVALAVGGPPGRNAPAGAGRGDGAGSRAGMAADRPDVRGSPRGVR